MLTGRIARVTGASGGLGQAIARGRAEAGSEVIVHGRDKARLDMIAAELVDAGRSTRALAVDWDDEAALREAVPALRPVDILGSNNTAGIGIERYMRRRTRCSAASPDGP